jgi:hypothetical protein
MHEDVEKQAEFSPLAARTRWQTLGRRATHSNSVSTTRCGRCQYREMLFPV